LFYVCGKIGKTINGKTMETTVVKAFLKAELLPGFEEILTEEALEFVVKLQRNFNKRRLELLAARVEKQKQIDSGKLPDFLPDTKSIREGDWVAAPYPGRPAGQKSRNHRSCRPQNDYQCPELRSEGFHG
jgi:malate synthase